MTRTKHYALTSALPAIAAALALSSTPLLAQAAQPVTPDPVAQPMPATEPTPPVTEATPVAPDPSATVTPDASAAPTATTTKSRTVRTVRTARIAAPKPAPVSTVTRTQATQRTTATAPAAVPPQAPVQSPASESAVVPVVDLNAKSATPPARPATTSKGADETLPIAGGALALLALGGGAYALSRRRRRKDEWVDDESFAEPAMERESAIAAPLDAEPRHDPIFDEQPAIVAPSAFAWGNTAPATQAVERDADDDRLPGETWVERAYRGPSANNPSVSLKNRLRRAAFFDKRERDVAAGIAEPVDPDAGLPDAIAEQQQRELT